jgi:hypothetical protein
LHSTTMVLYGGLICVSCIDSWGRSRRAWDQVRLRSSVAHSLARLVFRVTGGVVRLHADAVDADKRGVRVWRKAHALARGQRHARAGPDTTRILAHILLQADSLAHVQRYTIRIRHTDTVQAAHHRVWGSTELEKLGRVDDPLFGRVGRVEGGHYDPIHRQDCVGTFQKSLNRGLRVPQLRPQKALRRRSRSRSTARQNEPCRPVRSFSGFPLSSTT